MISRIRGLRRIEDALLDGAEMFRIQGTMRGATTTSAMTLWIDKSTFLVHRIETVTKSPTYHTVQTVSYLPSINVEISDSALKLNDPDVKK